MKEDLDSIIRLLEQAQELIEKGKHSEANTCIYYAQGNAQRLKDQISRNT